jgi:alpha-glucosidase
MDSLARIDIPQAIVIGIDNGQEMRMNEYNPFDSERFGPGEGKETMDFIVNQLKPMVDSMYRTKPERGYTTLGGSSMGGLMAFYAMSDYSEVFSKAIVFSPSFWISDQVEKWIPSLMKDTKIYMSMGSEEGEEMISEMNRMIELMKESGLGQDQLRTRLVNGMGHNEKLWTMEYPNAYEFLFEKGNQ